MNNFICEDILLLEAKLLITTNALNKIACKLGVESDHGDDAVSLGRLECADIAAAALEKISVEPRPDIFELS